MNTSLPWPDRPNLQQWSRDRGRRLSRRSARKSARPRSATWLGGGLERLEERLLLAADDVLSVGRTLSSWTTADLLDNQLTIKYTVFGQQDEKIRDVVLTTTLQPGVTFSSATRPTTQSGQQLSWDLGDLAPFGSASVEVVVTLDASLPLQLDAGASARGAVPAGVVSDDALPALLRTGAIDPALLGATVDADPQDPFIAAVAAKYDQDPNQLFTFMTQQVGFESYSGSLRGARGTVWSSAGNSLDQSSLLVALLRGSGVPAEYVTGTLTDPLAGQLIGSMFPEPQRVTGFLNAGDPVADPASDPGLLAETREHYWVRLHAGGSSLDADPSFAGAQLGQTFAAATGTFAEVPEALRHQVVMRLNREITTPAAGLLTGGSSQDLATVLEATYATAALVGRPVTVGFLVQTESVSLPVLAATTHRYSPYLMVGATSLDPSQDEVVRGNDFAETLTSFPLGSQILTGLFLDFELLGPGEGGRYCVSIADRIGSAARAGGSSVSVTLDDPAQPLVTTFDLTTINVLPAQQSRAAVLQQNQQVAELTSEFTSELEAIHALPPGPERDARLGELITRMTTTVVATSRARLAQLAAGSDEAVAYQADTALVRAYFDSPRIHVLRVMARGEGGDDPELSFVVDLLKNDIRTQPYPGQNPTAAVGFHMIRGISDTIVEQLVLEPTDPAGPLVAITGVARVFDLATQQGIATRTIRPEGRSQLDLLAIPADLRLLLSRTLDAGKLVIVPTGMVAVDGVNRFAWLEIDPVTGDTIGRLEDGSHGAFAEYAAGLELLGLSNPAEQFALGVLEATVTDLGIIAVAKFLAWTYISALGDTGFAPLDFLLAFKNNVGTMVKLASAFIYETTPLASPFFTAGFLAGLSFAWKYSNDPPVDGFLLSPEPLDELANLPDVGAPLSAAIVPDPLYHLRPSGAEVRTVFRLGVRNFGAAAETYQIDVQRVISGFEGQASVAAITVAPGATAEVGIALRPAGTIPAPGTDASFSVVITPQGAPGGALSLPVSFVVPAILGVELSAAPSQARTLVGTPTAVELTIHSTSNVAQSVSFDAEISAGLTVAGLSNLSLDPGQTVTQVLTLTPAADQPIGSELGLLLTADFGGQLPVVFPLNLRVAAPGAEATAEAAVAAGDLGYPQLSARLDDLSIALIHLAQDPASVVFKSQSLASLESVLSLLAVDPVLAGFAPPLAAARDGLAAASDPSTIQAAITDLGQALDDFAAVTQALTCGNVQVLLTPNSQAAQVQSPRNFTLTLHNVGTETTTYDLTVAGLPADVAGQLSETSVTLARDEFAEVLLTLTQTTDTELRAFDFRVDVSLAGTTPSIVKSASGSLRTRNAFISVTGVELTPPFGDPGTPVSVTAQLLNAVNRQQDALVAYTVFDAGGTPVFTSGAVPVTLTVQTSLATVALPPLDTTGFALGAYTLEVSVTDAQQVPLPGGSGSASLLVGLPITAEQSVTPSVLPPGASTVANSLQLSALADVGEPLTVVGHLPIDPFKQVFDASTNDLLHGLALNLDDDRLYVFGAQGFHVIDVADLENPGYVRNKAFTGFTNGIVDGDRLIVTGPGPITNIAASARGTLDYIDLGGVFGTADDPGRIQGYSFPYQFAGNGVLLAGAGSLDHLLVPTVQVRYTPGPGNMDIFSQNGTVLSFSVDPTRVFGPVGIFNLEDALLNENGTTIDSTFFENGGNVNIFDLELINPQTLYAASTTATGTDTQTGVGRILVIDVSNPADINSDPPNDKIVGLLDIPGTVQLHGIARDGNLALVVGSQGGWRDPFVDENDIGPTGNLVLAAVDLTDPTNPTLSGPPLVLNRSARGGGDNLISLGNGRFAFESLGQFDPADTPQLIVVDASDPANIQVVAQLDVPGEIRGLQTDGTYLYATGDDGLTIYRLGGSGDIPVTAEVQVPNNTGVAVVADSFNMPPTEIVAGATFDTLRWELTLSSASPAADLTWQTSVANLQPGQARQVTLGTTVDFVSQSMPGQVTLPPQSVLAEQILALEPASRTVQPGQAASFQLTVSNPAAAGVTYSLSVQGVPPAWVQLVPEVFVPAHGTVNLPLTLVSDPFAALADHGFVVTAAAGGTSGSVEGTLTLAGLPLLPEADPVARGVVVSLNPTQAVAGQGTAARFTARVTNTGSTADTFALSAAGLPAGVAVTLGDDVLEVPPGPNRFRDVTIEVIPAAGTAAGDLSFTVTAASTTTAGIEHEATGLVSVLSLGVQVELTPAVGRPGDLFQLIVTNIGQAAETFDLSLAAPAALVSMLSNSSVNLGPGASQVLTVDVGQVGFAFPGSLPLVATAAARSNPAITASDRAEITVAGLRDVAAEFTDSPRQLPAPGSTVLLLRVDNLGNEEDQYSAEIVQTTGPLTAGLRGRDGTLQQAIPPFTVPGLHSGALAVEANLADFGTGTVTVRITSLSNAAIFAEAIALVTTGSLPPVADPGGPYTVPEGGTIVLDGSNSSAADGGLSLYEWDLDYDGSTFDADATGVSPLFDATLRDGPAQVAVALRVVDSEGRVSRVSIAVVEVTNVRPTADAGGPYVVAAGGSVVLDGSGSSDPLDALVEYWWDLDYDDVTFDVDASGLAPVFDASSLSGPARRTSSRPNAWATSVVPTVRVMTACR